MFPPWWRQPVCCWYRTQRSAQYGLGTRCSSLGWKRWYTCMWYKRILSRFRIGLWDECGTQDWTEGFRFENKVVSRTSCVWARLCLGKKEFCVRFRIGFWNSFSPPHVFAYVKFPPENSTKGIKNGFLQTAQNQTTQFSPLLARSSLTIYSASLIDSLFSAMCSHLLWAATATQRTFLEKQSQMLIKRGKRKP